MTFKAQELALWYDRDERGSNWNILSPTNSVAYSTLCVTPYHSESYLGFAGLTNLLYCVTLFILTSSVILFNCGYKQQREIYQKKFYPDTELVED